MPSIYYFIILLLIVMTISLVYRSYKNGISPMPSNYIMHLAIMKQLDNLKIRVNIVDAGSGFGHLVFKLARKYPQHEYIGIENSTIPILYAKLIQRLAQNKILPITFKYNNIYSYNFEEADVIICYLYRKGTQRLYHTLQEQQYTGTLICMAFAIDHLLPAKIITCNDIYKTKIYIYEL